MPSLAHCTDSRLRPPGLLLEANGAPLSLRIARGRPSSRKACSTTGCTASIVSGTMRHSIRKRLSASVIVNGSQRCPSAVRNQPLKSMHHRSLGSCTGRKGWLSGTARRRRRRGSLSP